MRKCDVCSIRLFGIQETTTTKPKKFHQLWGIAIALEQKRIKKWTLPVTKVNWSYIIDTMLQTAMLPADGTGNQAGEKTRLLLEGNLWQGKAMIQWRRMPLTKVLKQFIKQIGRSPMNPYIRPKMTKHPKHWVFDSQEESTKAICCSHLHHSVLANHW